MNEEVEAPSEDEVKIQTTNIRRPSLLDSSDVLVETLRPLEDPNRTLDLDKRRTNLMEVYTTTIPDLVARNATFDEATRTIHAIAMNGSSLLNLENVANRLNKAGVKMDESSLSQPGQYRNRETTDAIGYKTTLKGRLHEDNTGDFMLHLPSPSEERIVDLMEGISSNFERLLTLIEDPDDRIRLAAWVSQLAFFVHPFYDGNGRTGRALFTFATQRSGLQPIAIESERQSSTQDALPLTPIGFSLLLKLYGQNMDALPEYIPVSKQVVTGADILGLPENATEDEATIMAQKQRSLERLFTEHLATVDMQQIRGLFTDEQIAVYKNYSQALQKTGLRPLQNP